MTEAERALFIALCELVEQMATNPMAAVGTARFRAALLAFKQEACPVHLADGTVLAPMVREPADVVLRRAREAMGEPPVSALRPPNEPDEIERLRRALIRIRDKCDWERDFAVRVATEALEP